MKKKKGYQNPTNKTNRFLFRASNEEAQIIVTKAFAMYSGDVSKYLREAAINYKREKK